MSDTSHLDPARVGKLTGSMASVIMGKLNTDGLDEYTRRLAGERLYGPLQDEGFATKHMRRGQAVEHRALDWYEFHTDEIVERQVFLVHPIMPYVACTTDALIRGVRTIEAKCPTFQMWSHTKQTREVPSIYRWQCRWEAWCAGVRQFHFVAWHPQGGGVIVEEQVTEEEVTEMTNRAITVEMMIQELMEEIR